VLRQRIGTTGFVVAVLSVLAMATSGQAGAAATPHTSSAGSMSRPAPIDPSGGGLRRQATRAATPTHTVPNPLLKEQFSAGDDDNGADPAVSALCQSFIGQPTPYHALAPNVDAINGDNITVAGSSAGCGTTQNETTVAVNPFNPRNIVEGSNDYRIFNARENRNDASGWAYTSFDGGKTFKDVELPKLNVQTGAAAPLSFMDAAGDPAIAFGPFNTVYYATLVFSRAAVPDGQQQASGIAVSVSHNGGLSFGAPAILHLDGVTRRRHAHPDVDLQRQGMDRRRPGFRHRIRDLDPVHLRRGRQFPGITRRRIRVPRLRPHVVPDAPRRTVAERFHRWHHAVRQWVEPAGRQRRHPVRGL